MPWSNLRLWELNLWQLNELVQEISDTNGIPELGDKLITNFKNTVSDRALAQRNFLTTYWQTRTSLLPKVLKEYDSMSQVEKEKVQHMNNFFCGLQTPFLLS